MIFNLIKGYFSNICFLFLGINEEDHFVIVIVALKIINDYDNEPHFNTLNLLKVIIDSFKKEFLKDFGCYNCFLMVIIFILIKLLLYSHSLEIFLASTQFTLEWFNFRSTFSVAT